MARTPMEKTSVKPAAVRRARTGKISSHFFGHATLDDRGHRASTTSEETEVVDSSHGRDEAKISELLT